MSAKNHSAEPIAEEHYTLEAEHLHPAIKARAFKSGDYPYDAKMKTKQYEKELHRLQIELCKVQDWQRQSGDRIVMVFEGRDTAGKGGGFIMDAAVMLDEAKPENLKAMIDFTKEYGVYG